MNKNAEPEPEPIPADLDKPVPGLEMRFTEATDAEEMRKWFDEPGVLRWFPMEEPVEIDDSVQRWIGFSRYKCSLTAVFQGEICGIATLYLQPYKKLMHQCEFGIIVSPKFRGRGIGGDLLRNLFHLAKTRFRVKIIHLQVYDDNPAIRLYERFGFKQFGYQKGWIRESDGEYRGRIFMERYL